jgi:NADPH-dependent 2,4-dienoyl-CoA reductase/sulfur reductase-like enzyme/rhodanese-related sulfurtransferase
MAQKIVIVGGVATGPKAAARCRRLNPEADIVVIEKQDLLSYAGCGMPFFIEDTIKDWNTLLGGSNPRDATYFEKNKGVKIIDNAKVEKINRGNNSVTVHNLKTDELFELPYDKLVLATGASPFVPMMEGTDLHGVHRLYNPHDARAIKLAVDEGAKKVAVVGGGLIGMETCGAFVARGCEVIVFEMMPNIVPNLLDEEMAMLLERYLIERGVKFVKGSPVSKIIGDVSGKVSEVETKDGRKVEADLVIIAIGVRPNTELAIDAGLEIGLTRAIAVNEYLQTNDPEIFAGGDCVENTHLITGEKVFVPLGSTANKHGRVIGDNLNGMQTKFPGVMGTAVFKILDYNCGATGITERKALELGYDVVTTLCPRYDYSNYIPEAKHTIIKLIADKQSCKVLGCQVVGEGDGIKRIDVVATAMKFQTNLKTLADLDLGYAPPYSTAIDAIAHAANVLRNKIQGIAHGIGPIELRKKLESNEDFILLDVREPNEFQDDGFRDSRCINMPLSELKGRKKEISQEKEIITYCVIGVRAYIAERVLRGLGYKDVKFLDGCLKSYPFPVN